MQATCPSQQLASSRRCRGFCTQTHVYRVFRPAHKTALTSPAPAILPALPIPTTPTDRARSTRCRVFPFDEAWSPNAAAASIAPQLFAGSLFPYLGFLFFLHKSGKAPRLTLFGFYFLLAFVAATIPAGIYAKVHYGTSLANVDWLHGLAESLLTITNLLIVLGLRQGIREEEAKKAQQEQTQAEEQLANAPATSQK